MLPWSCKSIREIPFHEPFSRSAAISDTCNLMVAMGKGRYRILLVRHMSAAASDALLGFSGPQPRHGEVWVVVVHGPYRVLDCIVQEPSVCKRGVITWGTFFGPARDQGVFGFSAGHDPAALRAALAQGS